MSDVSQGPGWWQASDGKWYPPEQHPTPQASAPPPTGGPAPAVTGAGASTGAGTPSFSFDLGNLSQSEKITGVATLVLFISLFLPWFTYSFKFASFSSSVSVDGLWHGWMYLVLILCLAILAYLVMRCGYRELPFKLPIAEEQLLLVGTVVNAVLSILGFLLKPGGIGFTGIGWGFGAFLGLIASIVAAAPLAVPAINARRARTGLRPGTTTELTISFLRPGAPPAG